jgi:hypothetical protein
VTTQGFRATLLDGAHRPMMTGWHLIAELLSVGWPVLAEDLGQRHHEMLAIT